MNSLRFSRLVPAPLTLPRSRTILALSLGAACGLSGAFLAPALAVPGTILALGLAWAAMIDIDRFILPDPLTLGLLVIGLGFALTNGVTAAQPYACGAIIGYLALAGVGWAYRHIRKRNGLGLGDAKLLAAGGAWLGWAALPFVVLIASVACLATVLTMAHLRGQRITSEPVPLGPYLAAGIWIMWLVQLNGRF